MLFEAPLDQRATPRLRPPTQWLPKRADRRTPAVPCLRAERPDDLVSFARSERSSIRRLLSEHGALLLRGFDSTPADFERAFEALGFALDNDYSGGVSPRTGAGGRRFTSTETPKPFIIASHNEMCYVPQRPGTIAFYCELPPTADGETPVFDCARMYNRLRPDLRRRLLSEGVMYRRSMREKPHWLRVLKPWTEVFRTSNRHVVEAECERLRMEYRWRPDGSLWTESRLPGIVKHPVTGHQCVNLTISNVHALSDNMRRFRNRFHPALRAGIHALSRYQYGREDVFFETRWGDGSPISLEDTRALGDAAWESAVMFPWRAGDLLILDNIRWAHGRLNVRSPRRILAMLGDSYDVAALPPAAASA